eukprot:g11257.t1
MQTLFIIGMDKAKRKTCNLWLQDMKRVRHKDSGRLVFTCLDGNECGNIIPEEKLRSWFSGQVKKQKDNQKNTRFMYWNAKKVAELRELLQKPEGDKTKRDVLAQEMCDKEAEELQESGETKGFDMNSLIYTS